MAQPLEFGTCRAPWNTVAVEMCEHRRPIDFEAVDEPDYGIPVRVRGNQLLDVIGSEPVLDLSVTVFSPMTSLRVDLPPAL